MTRDSVARNALFITLNSLVTGAGGFLFWFVATRHYAPTAIGVATAGTSMTVFLSVVSQLGLGITLVRYYAVLGPRRARRVLGIFMVPGALAVIVGLAFWKLTPLLAPGLSPLFVTPAAVGWFVGSCAIWTVSVLYDQYLMSRQLNGLLVVKNSIAAVSRIVLVGALSHLSSILLVAMTGIGGAVGMLTAAAIVLGRRTSITASTAPVISRRTLLTYSLWNYVSLLAAQGAVLIMPTIIISRLGSAEAGAYYMAWTLFSVILLIPGALSWAVLADKAAVLQAGGRYASVKHGRSTRLMVLITGLFIPFALLVLLILGHSYISKGWVAVLLFAAGVVPYHRANLLLAEMRLIGSQRLLAVAYTASQVVVVIVTIPLLSLLGTSGAALAWTAGQCMLFFWLRWSLPATELAGERAT